jgi:hypothetical protein
MDRFTEEAILGKAFDLGNNDASHPPPSAQFVPPSLSSVQCDGPKHPMATDIG